MNLFDMMKALNDPKQSKALESVFRGLALVPEVHAQNDLILKKLDTISGQIAMIERSVSPETQLI